jgi:transcriptional regulator with XRE-family HTH domain
MRKTTGQQVRARRAALKLTIEQCATVGGISHGAWRKVEGDEYRTHTSATVAAVAKALLWPADWPDAVGRGRTPEPVDPPEPVEDPVLVELRALRAEVAELAALIRGSARRR